MNTEYLYLDFASGVKRKTNLYTYGTDEEPTVVLLRLTYRGEVPVKIQVPNQLAGNEELINIMAEEAPNANVTYFGASDELRQDDTGEGV
jgi:hypothetical protein